MFPRRLRLLGPWLGFLLLVPALPSGAQAAGADEGQRLLLAADEALAVEGGMGVAEVSISVLVDEEPARHRTFWLFRDASKKAALWLFPSEDRTRFRGFLAEPSGLSLLDADPAAVHWKALKPSPGKGRQWPSDFGGETVATDATLGQAIVGPAGKDEAGTTVLFRLDWFLADARAPRYKALSVVADKVGQTEASLVEAKALDPAAEIQSVKLWIDKKTGLVVREDRYDRWSRRVERIATQYGRLNGLMLPTKRQYQLTTWSFTDQEVTVKAGISLKYGKPGPPRFDLTDRGAVERFVLRMD